METKEVKKFYEAKISRSQNKYEYDRWESNSQARASYVATRDAFDRLIKPLVSGKSNILELGPGPGTWTKELLKIAPEASYTLVDISEEMLKQAKMALSEYSNVTFVNSDIIDYSTEEVFDFFFSSRMIEYVPDKKPVIEKIVRMLRTGSFGYIVTKTPQYDRPFSREVSAEVHRNQITANDFVKLIEESGCSVVKVQSVTSVFPGMRSGLLDRCLSALCQYLPFSLVRYVSESYVVVFKKSG